MNACRNSCVRRDIVINSPQQPCTWTTWRGHMYHETQKMHLTTADEWESVRTQLHAEFGREIFENFLKTMQLDEARSNGDTVHLTVAKRFLAKWVTEQYLDDIRAVWTNVRGVDVVIHITDREQRKRRIADEKTAKDPFETWVRPDDFPRDTQTRTASKLLEAKRQRLAPTSINIEMCIAWVARRHHVTRTDIRSETIVPRIRKPKRIAMYLARILTSSSNATIARRFCTSASTVEDEIRVISIMLANNSELAAEIQSCIEELGANECIVSSAA